MIRHRPRFAQKQSRGAITPASFSHLKSKLLAEQIEDQIYHDILDAPFAPGAKLPNEFELGERFGVGRSTIREAVKLLSGKGIVKVRRGSGTYVVTTTRGRRILWVCVPCGIKMPWHWIL